MNLLRAGRYSGNSSGIRYLQPVASVRVYTAAARPSYHNGD
jgi:hypothetical protein